MTARRTTTIVATLAVALAGLAPHATAADPLDKLLDKVVKNLKFPYPTPVNPPCLLPGGPWEPGFRPLPAPRPEPMPYPLPYPAPAPTTYFLGVYTSTVAVSMPGGGAVDGPQAYVVPGYGEQVFGQRVNKIVPNSPAFHAGLEPGDILVNANGIALDSDELLRAAIAESEGYLEMQVLGSRSGQLVWVIAETDPQNPMPAFASSSNLNTARTAFTTKSNQRTGTAKAGSRGRSTPNRSTQGAVKSLSRQPRQTSNGNRRPPVRRR
jgi:membrane-associated protease RseP (regulator of RpoE activity)